MVRHLAHLVTIAHHVYGADLKGSKEVNRPMIVRMFAVAAAVGVVLAVTVLIVTVELVLPALGY